MKRKPTFEESSKNFEFWMKWDAPKGHNFGPFSGPMYPQKNQNIVNTKICAKTAFLGLSSNINPKFILGIDKNIFDLVLHIFWLVGTRYLRQFSRYLWPNS